MREDVTVDSLQDDLATAIGGYDEGIIDQPLPMRVDSADYFVRDELTGDTMCEGHADKGGRFDFEFV